MILSEICAKHPNSFCILTPLERDENQHASSWEVVNTCSTLDDAKRLYDVYAEEQLSGVVVFDTSEAENEEQATMWARFWRVYFNQD